MQNRKGLALQAWLPANSSTQLGWGWGWGSLLETSISFAASFAVEKLLCVMMSATDSWESVAPGASHYHTSNFHFASQNDPGSQVLEGKGSVGICWGRFGQSVHRASSGCFWPAVLATLQALHTTNTSPLWFEEPSGTWPSLLEAGRGGRMAGNEKIANGRDSCIEQQTEPRVAPGVLVSVSDPPQARQQPQLSLLSGCRWCRWMKLDKEVFVRLPYVSLTF